MKALPVRFFHKRTKKFVQAFQTEDPFCFTDNVDCIFFRDSGVKSCFCKYPEFYEKNVIFLEVEK